MSILRSYINKNNTILSGEYTNTGRNPIIELNFGQSDNIIINNGFTRFLFDIDLSLLQSNIQSGIISTGCTTGCTTGMTHTLRMTNTSSFEYDLINGYMPNQRRRASSFDLILFRIPKTSGDNGDPQNWDEGVGYDFFESNKSKGSYLGGIDKLTKVDSRSYSNRPSNWYQTNTISKWSEPGVYNNLNLGNVNYSGLTIIDRQHFSVGNEDLEMDMTDEINGILNGTITGVTGWGVAYVPEIENITGLTDSFSVAFFSRHTQTFYQPYLLTTYDDLINDNRNLFLKNQENKLYLYVYQDGNLVNLDNVPSVQIQDRNGNIYNGLSGLTPCLKTKGVYEVTVPNSFTESSSPCVYYDIWSNLSINCEQVPNIKNQFTLQSYNKGVHIGSHSKQAEKFAFNVYGILQNEKISSSDIRKVGVTVKKAYTSQQLMENISLYYRIYVREGNTEVQIQNWTSVNKTPNEYYFIFDSRDKIPNEYFIDLQVRYSGQIDTYKKVLTFQIEKIKNLSYKDDNLLTNNKIPSCTPTITTSSLPSPTQLTLTPTPTQTLTPTIIPPSEEYFAYVFPEPQDSESLMSLGSYMYDNGASLFFGFGNTGIPDISTYSNDLSVYASFSGFTLGGGNKFKVPISSLSGLIRQSSGTGVDSFGCEQQQYTFGTIEIGNNDVDSGTTYFYTVWIQTDGIPISWSNMKVLINREECSTTLSDSIPLSSLSSQVVNVGSGSAIPEGTYRILWMPYGGYLPPEIVYNYPIYFKGQNLIF